MRYQHISRATFLSRPNRFIARVEREGEELTVHVKNTGRCRELLVPGATVYLEESENPARKTRFDLVAVEKGKLLINMDSQAPNAAAGEWLRAGGLLPAPTLVRPECRFGNSRFDFYLENRETRMFLEVKGVTLEREGEVLFADAPTQRGGRHLRELMEAGREVGAAGVLFVIQMETAIRFRPNRETHPAFADALREARDAGVQVLARACRVTPESMTLSHPVPVVLE